MIFINLVVDGTSETVMSGSFTLNSLLETDHSDQGELRGILVVLNVTVSF